MRIFVYEHVTGGGMLAAEPAPSLVREADLMVRSLLRDLAELPGIEPIASRDPRFVALEGVVTITPEPDEDPLALYRRGLTGADAAWPTAPETGGALEALARATVEAGKLLLGSSPEAVRNASSKLLTARTLQAAGIPVVPTFASADALPALPGGWVVKPDDGAGAEDTFVVPDWRAARAELSRRDRFVAEPWLEGESLSLSLLCHDGHAELLACNRQEIDLSQGRVSLAALEVNALADQDGSLARLGDQISSAIPGLLGYVGVDLIRTGAAPVVVDVNPRLTTSYCGLRPALGINVAQMVLEAVTGRARKPRPRPAGRAVTLLLTGTHG